VLRKVADKPLKRTIQLSISGKFASSLRDNTCSDLKLWQFAKKHPNLTHFLRSGPHIAPKEQFTKFPIWL
jgi:hypothetical protein